MAINLTRPFGPVSKYLGGLRCIGRSEDQGRLDR
jgi:hypothetical protein